MFVCYYKPFKGSLRGQYVGEGPWRWYEEIKIWRRTHDIFFHKTKKKVADTKNHQNYIFLLTSRFTQDCLENLFGNLRSKQIIPNSVQFKDNLKLITVSQYLRDVSKGSCETYERQFLSGFLEIIKKMTNLQKRITFCILYLKTAVSG